MAQIARQTWGDKLTLTGHSLGGALATHASQQQGVSRVYTFNAARLAFSTGGKNDRQINIIVPGDNVSDSATRGANFFGDLIGKGCVPGKMYTASTTAYQGDGIAGLLGSHDMKGLIVGLEKDAK